MRRDIIGWAVAGLTITLAVSMGAMQQPAARVGRFQIVSGVTPTGPPTKTSFSMLLDTETGATRVLVYGDSGVRWTLPTTVDAD